MERSLTSSCSEKKGYRIRHGSGYSTLSLLVGLCPKSSVLLPRLTLVVPELIHILKWETGISEPIGVLDDLSVEEGTVF